MKTGDVLRRALGELHPERIRSLTMLSAIGIQEGEGSGSYAVEHAKYGAGYAAALVLPEIVPHFGFLGPRSLRRDGPRHRTTGNGSWLTPRFRSWDT